MGFVANGAGVALSYLNGENGNTGLLFIYCSPGAPNVTNVRFTGIVRHSFSLKMKIALSIWSM